MQKEEQAAQKAELAAQKAMLLKELAALKAQLPSAQAVTGAAEELKRLDAMAARRVSEVEAELIAKKEQCAREAQQWEDAKR